MGYRDGTKHIIYYNKYHHDNGSGFFSPNCWYKYVCLLLWLLGSVFIVGHSRRRLGRRLGRLFSRRRRRLRNVFLWTSDDEQNRDEREKKKKKKKTKKKKNLLLWQSVHVHVALVISLIWCVGWEPMHCNNIARLHISMIIIYFLFIYIFLFQNRERECEVQDLSGEAV